MRDIVVVDLEATCWDPKDGQYNRDDMEIIEIGATVIKNGMFVERLQVYVKPILHPILSDFCTELTGITQAQVDAGTTFADAYMQFVDLMINHDISEWGSWGNFDYNIMFRQWVNDSAAKCRFDNFKHTNLKYEYSNIRKMKRMVGMAKALENEKMELLGKHHSAVDDSYNIARIMTKIYA